MKKNVLEGYKKNELKKEFLRYKQQVEYFQEAIQGSRKKIQDLQMKLLTK